MHQPASVAPMKYGPCNAYFSMIEWAERFQAPVYLHEADSQWVMRPDKRITYLSGEAIAPYRFERLYAAWFERVVSRDASMAVQRSAERYLKAIEERTEGLQSS